jgi:hypothetical protein
MDCLEWNSGFVRGGLVLSRIKRQRRVGCRLKCEIVVAGRRGRVRGRVVSVSEGGLSVVADLDLEQGDTIRLLIEKDASRPPVKVSAIVWNDHSASPTGRASRLRRIGCVVSEPPRSFLALLGEVVSESATERPAPIPIARPMRVDPEVVEFDLPRSRDLQPPPKSEPDETLPYFRVRLKQIGGPRTRVLTLRARSATQAERLALVELENICSDADGWGVLHIARLPG